MSTRPATHALLGAALVASLAFAVAPSPVQSPEPGGGTPLATDEAGDANALNGQGLEDLGTTSTPAQVDDADIRSARITSIWTTSRGADGLLDRHFAGVQFRTELTRLPDASSVPVLHRFVGTIDGCETWVQFAAGSPAGASHGTASVRQYGTGCGMPDDPDTGLRGSRTFSGPGISWSTDLDTGEAIVTIAADRVDAELAETVTDGALYLLTEVYVRHYSPAGITAPVIDEMAGQNGFAYLGEDVPADQQPGEPDDDQAGGVGNDVPRDTTPVCGRYDDDGGSTQPTGSDRTGVTADTLRLGVHAPATGAAPLPTTSFENSRDLYWRAVTEDCGDTVLGRTSVEVEFRDDKYAPENAIQVCRELSASSFLLFAADGTDQIQACGQLAAHAEFPYLSTGVTENGLTGNPWYFGSTMSFRQQGGLLAQYVAANPDDIDGLGPDARIGTLITNTPNLKDARDGWLQGVQDNGLTNLETFEHPKGDTSWYADTAQRFKQQGIAVVYALMSPVDLINFARTADERFGYNPRFIGVASSTSLNAVLASGCSTTGRGVDGGVWLSPTPGLDAAPTAFFEAAEVFGAPDDDIALRLWAAAEQQHELLAGYGRTFGDDLTREDFRAFVEGSGIETTGTFPAASWTQQDHFPNGGMHVVQANCELKEHVTLHLDAAGF